MHRQPSFPLGAVILGLSAITASPEAALAQKGNVTVEKVEYQGWKNNLRLGNGDVELIVTLDIGPRILSYRLANGKNVFKEYADQMGKTGEDEWKIRGGHRLWCGPEDHTRTYALDNGPVTYEEAGPGIIKVRPKPDTDYGVQKEIEIQVPTSGTGVTLVHRITNIGEKGTVLAPWSISVMAPGGVEIIPLPPKRPHPGSPKNARSPADYAADQIMVVWPYLDFQDPRWHFGSKFITLRQDPNRGPTKLGLAHKTGGVGYLNAGTLFVKRFEFAEDKPYPDAGVNFETFTNEDMLEIETLGPITVLEPGKTVEHTERWELVPNMGEIGDEAAIEKTIAPKLK
jgi:hypothetical protein